MFNALGVWEEEVERATSRKSDTGEQSGTFLKSRRNCLGKEQIRRPSV